MRAAIVVLVAGLAVPFAGARADDPPKGWEFAGRTQAAAAVEVRARVTGSLTRVAVQEGETVKTGDLLAEVDPRPYQLDRDAARARVRAAAAKLQAARLKTTNARKLMQTKVVSPDEVALQEAAAEEADAGLAAAKAEAERAEWTLAQTQLRAPIDGRVTRAHATLGNLVVADQTPVLTVVATDRLHVSFDVDEATLLRLRRGGLAEPGRLDLAVGFTGEEGYPHAATLDLVAAEVDPGTGAGRFRATLANPKGLLAPGMFARVRLTPRPK